MIGYVCLGTNDLARATTFYDKLLGALGATHFMEAEGKYVFWAVGPTQAGLGVVVPHDGNSASVGNGVMVALAVESREKVDQMYALALELGATDEGLAGPRGDNFYAGYFRDLDGNKLNFFYM